MRALAHLRELEESLKYWQRYQSISLENLKRERDKRNMVLHAMFVSIQAAIDVATYLIAEEGLGKPVHIKRPLKLWADTE